MRTKVLQTMRNHLIRATLLGAVVVLASAGLAQASPTMTVTANSAINGIPPFPAGCGLNGTQTQDCWEPESGQSMPTGTAGYLNGRITVNGPGFLTFTYGAGLLGGDTGHGNSGFANEVWIGNIAAEGAAEAAGQCFATQPGTGCAVSVPNVSTFSIPVSAGPLLFTYRFGGPQGTIDSLTTLNAINTGAYMAACSPLSGGPLNASCTSSLVYVGLTDAPYTSPALAGDHDFQDLVFRVQGVPEPASMLLLGFGLLGVAFVARRRKNLAA